MRLHNGAIKLPFPPFLLPRDEWVNFILGKLGRRGGRATFFRDSFFFSPRNNYLSDEREAWSVESRKLRNQLCEKRLWKFKARCSKVPIASESETPDDPIPFCECYFSLSNERGSKKRTRKRIATITKKERRKSMKDRRASRSLSGERKDNNNNNKKV